jgi:hypothetical protein
LQKINDFTAITQAVFIPLTNILYDFLILSPSGNLTKVGGDKATLFIDLFTVCLMILSVA